MTAPGTMELHRAFAFLCLVFSVGAQSNHRLTCYLDVLTHHTREGPCTHIILPSISSDEDLYHQSLSEDDCSSLRKMKERNPTLKILLGLEVRSSRLELMSANEGSVEHFVQTVLTYLKDKSLDGLDVSWLDSPTSDVSNRSKELFTHFLKSLKHKFEEETDPLLLSVTVLEATDHSAVSYDEQTLSQYVDFISILPAHLEKDGPYINKTVQHWQEQQVDLQKLNLVMPGFLRRSRRRHHHRHLPRHDDLNSEEGKKDHIHVLGLYMGVQVCQAIKSGREQFITLPVLSEEHSLFKEVLQNGFGGVGVVFIDPDVFANSLCANITQDEWAIFESKVIMSHHGRDDHHHHHHGRDRHHSRQHHHRSSHLPHGSSHLPHGSHDIGHHHHRHGHHRHERHHRHGHRHHPHHHAHSHSHHHPITQSNMTREERQGVE
ncbi:histidine-rich carboxyl terminus protein 1 [Pseudorasbora parva]|uniref:histidine-rich carboxyl terminus protein 1 n=1 Tax=Pseudorasbora parva TaxID=51549 RepID=UPI00351E52C3